MQGSITTPGGQALRLSPAALFAPAGFMGVLQNDAGQSLADLMRRALHLTRQHFGMEAAFLSEFRDGRRILRYVDADAGIDLAEGASLPLEHTCCARVADGRIGAAIPDAARCHDTAHLPDTARLRIGAFLGVPVRLADGTVFGTLCCFSTRPDPTLNQRDAQTMLLLAEFTAGVLQKHAAESATRRTIEQRIRGVLEGEDFEIVYQPIVTVSRRKLAGYEALTRFRGEQARTPDLWFQEAAAVGLQEQLEIAVLRKALEGLACMPRGLYLSVNVSPATILADGLWLLLRRQPLRRLVLEVTEHASVDDYGALDARLAPMRQLGLRLAVDDAGAGFASLRHILRIRPDDIKLDISLVRRIDTDLHARALAASLIRYARETGSKVVAEGVETESVLQVLRDLRVDKAQGYLIGRPGPLPAPAASGTKGACHA